MNYLSAALAYMSKHGKKHMTIKRVTNKYTLIDTGECRTRMGGGGVVVVVTSTVGRDDNTAPPYTGTAFDTRARTRRGRVSCAPTPAPRHTYSTGGRTQILLTNRGVRRRARAASQFAMPKPTTAGMPTSLSHNHLADD